MNAFKRFLSMLLVLCMLTSVVPLTTLADEADDTESTEAPAQESTEAAEEPTEAAEESTEVTEETTAAATFGLTLGTKPADGTVTGEPFDTAVSANYRIPGLVNHNGTLIATADARWDYEKDGGGMDLVVSRSTDGNTWNYTFAGYLGDNGNVWNNQSSTLMDPVIISDGSTLYLLADMFPAGYSISSSSTANVFSDTAIGFDADGNLLLSGDNRNSYGYYLKGGKVLTAAGAETGYTVDGWFDLYQNGTYVTNLFFSDSPFQVRATSYICMSTSTDGGMTWNDPTLVNAKPEGVAWMVLGPGSGLALENGNIAFTAYDNSKIYLIWGSAANGWNRVATNAAANESSIIKLNDGTIRAFVKRGGSNTIAYVDFTCHNGTYTAGNLVDTGVTNFSQCMVSSLHYSKTLNGKEVVLVCCPSKPGSGDWNGRFNGKIHMFTLDDNNAMTLEGSYALNGESEFFAYSNMAEMNDGTIAVLYEDDCISYAAGSHYGDASHITYTSVDPEIAFGVTFDAESAGTEPDDSQTAVNTVEVELEVGETEEFTESSGAYSTATTVPDTDIVTMTVTGNARTEATYTVADEIESGAQYLITSGNSMITSNTSTGYEGQWSGAQGLLMTTDTASLEQHLWTITKVDGGYTVKNADGKYLNIAASNNNVTLSDTSVVLSVIDNGTTFTIHNNNYCLNNFGGGNVFASCWSGTGDDNAAWTLKKYSPAVAASTEVTFTGKAPGTTYAVVGNTQYNITVTGEVRDITLYVGKSRTDTISNAGYTTDDVTADPDKTYATLDSVVSSGAKLVEVSGIESGKHYLIVNKRTGDVLTNAAVSATGSWDDKPGLDTTGKAATDSTELWTITASGNGYTIVQDEKYLTISGFYADMSDTETALTLKYSASGWTIMDNTTCASLSGHDQADFYLSDNVGNGYDEAALGTSDTANEYRYWAIYEIDSAGSTDVTFTGKKAGTTTATVGRVIYNITVKPLQEGNISDFNNIVGVDQYSDDNSNETYRSDLNMAGKKITSLRITEGASFHLGVDVTGYDQIAWNVADPSIATVDSSGNVTAVKAGETTVTATVIKDGIEESISIPVVVVPSLVEGHSETTTVFYYIDQIDDTDPYYTMFLSTANSESHVADHYMVPVTEGEVIWFERPKNSALAWIWTADPWEAHALTLMSSTGSVSQYYSLRQEDGTLGEDYNDYYKGSQAYYNIIGTDPVEGGDSVGKDAGVSWDDALNALLEDAILVGKDIWPTYGCDGAMSNTRYDHDGVPKTVTSMTFISDPVPTISKTVDGVLPTTRLRADYRKYTEGMVAGVDELVYFKITVTLERPTVWEDEANGIGAITYSNSIVSDTVLDGAYLYTTELDQADGTYDGEIEEDHRTQTTEITEKLNAAWASDEKTRTIELYLVYRIKEEDIPRFIIDNVANLNTNYQSKYSTGVSARKADAKASITVVGRAMDNVVIDFGQKVQISGLGDNYLKGVYIGENVKYHATYGTVEIVENSAGTYDVTYTPTSILQGPDTVWLYGDGVDENENTVPDKIINGFVVYPATTVYYEEGFLFNDESTGWDLTNAAEATMVQAYEPLGKSIYDKNGTLTSKISGKVNAYGYDPIYDSGNTGSAGTYAVSNAPGAATSFTFTGTGFELYANSTEGSGYVTVYSKGKLNKLYMINTVLKPGTTGATEQQHGGTYYGLPVISETDLPYGTYEVQIKQTRGDAPIYIDGVRIINTIEDSSIFTIDEEDNPDFYELRDYVLKAIGVENLTESEYIDPDDRVGKVDAVKDMAGQVYNAVSDDDSAIVINEEETTFTEDQAQDLLDNGPKNELYLYPGQTLVFKVNTDRVVQLGLKSPVGSAEFTLTVNEKTLSLNSLSTTVDMFYKIADKGESTAYTVSINVTGGVLSVTNLKICDDPHFTFSALTQEDIETALLGANGLLLCNHSGGTATCNTLAQCGKCGESYGDFSTEHAYGEDDICDDCGKSAIVITQQPANGEAKLGQRYMVEVKAEGEDLKYQWYFRNAGASRWSKSSVKDNTYDDVMTAARAGREVYCVITDANGYSVATEIAKLICLPSEELAITKQPTDGEAVLGERYCVTVEAKGEGLKYQWYFRNKGATRWTKSSVTDNTYDDIMTKTRDGREVYCVITDLAGNKVTTDIVKLVSIPMKLEIVTQPTDATASFDEMFCVTVEARGEGVKYQWYYRNAGGLFWRKSGVRDNTYDDIMTKARNGREVYCVITDKYGNSVTTDIVKLIAVPKVELKLLSQTYESAAMGERYCVTVEAEGDGLKYQWYFRNAGATKWNKSGVKDNTYDDVMNRTRANREVYCVITDAFGNQIITEVVMITPRSSTAGK